MFAYVIYDRFYLRDKAMERKFVVTLIALFLSAAIASWVTAGDLDDGISKFTDDGIGKYDEMGKAGKNITFIVMNAQSKADMLKDGKDKTGSDEGGDANMNSVVLGAGSLVKGDIYIIDKSKGPKTNVAQ